MMITCCDSMSDIFDRPSWYRGMIGKREITRLRIRGRIQKKRKRESLRCGFIGSTNAIEGLKAVFTCWEFFGPLWLHVNEWILSITREKYLFMKGKQEKTRCTIKEAINYVINYYYCYDYYLQRLLHHYRIIRRLNKLPKKTKIQINTYIWSIMHSG